MNPKLLAACLLLTLAHGLPAAERAIDLETVVAGRVDAVWEAWTTSDGIKSFFAPDAHVELRVEGPFEVFIRYNFPRSSRNPARLSHSTRAKHATDFYSGKSHHSGLEPDR